MALEIEKLLDETGWHLLAEVQDNARLSFSELGQRVGLSSPAVAERLRKMEEVGIITGYHAEVNTVALGLPVIAVIRLSSIPGQNVSRATAAVTMIPAVVECYRVTGGDSIIFTVVAANVDHLEKIIDEVTEYGTPTTSLVLSNPRKRRTITSVMLPEEPVC
ncbi:Lrp/AsnC family transcriptional regulator [Dictyobacter arantiisoli]|uniref:AsnC family transcriptional regulator n=1 Tax=Dictyobacter arantiisoli TaxID=2014874 RepID=A0A5A5TIP8_9CHLR|nr:Lrp/AsnC family transcriptional regulator [Dictyobacter arantiisoli]GCF11480.1 AsnC family transcriptional regulator [Dictyobacter arantiisoli]